MKIPLRVVIVEDNPSDAELIRRRLNNEGFDFVWVRVENQQDYIKAVQQGCDLILSDWSLPEFSGLKALMIAAEMKFDIPFIIISGSIGEEAAVDALLRGAADYILKDRPDRLGQAIRNALEQKALRDQHKQDEIELRKANDFMNNLLKHANAPILVWNAEFKITRFNNAFERLTGHKSEEVINRTMEFLFPEDNKLPSMQLVYDTAEKKHWEGIEIPVITKNGEIRIILWSSANIYDPVDHSIIATIAQGQDITDRKEAERKLIEASDELQTAYDATLQGWSNALELRERETAGHSHRVVEMTLSIAQRLGISREKLIHIQRGALLHDIGKMGIPDSILLKKGPLDEEEWDIMRQHPIYAHNLLSKIPYLEPALEIPYYHHERWNGSGYPEGLKGKDIPLAARIFAIVDVWDALSYDRPYRSAWNREKVIEYLQKESGNLFDPEIIEVFFELEEMYAKREFLS